MKFLINAFIIVFALVSVGVAYKYYQNYMQTTAELNKERYSRMRAEEQLTSLDSKVNSLEIDLARSKNDADSSARRLNEIQKSNEVMKNQLASLTEEKKKLDVKLDETKKQLSGQEWMKSVGQLVQ